MIRSLGLMFVLAGMFVLSGCGEAEQSADTGRNDAAGASTDGVLSVAAQIAHYPLDRCIVGSEPLGSMGEPDDYLHEGRLVRFCCAACRDGFAADSERYLGELDEAVIAAQKESYPLTSCVVTGAELGSHGEIADVVIANRLVRLCCAGCLPQLHEDPAAYLKKIDEDDGNTGGQP